MFNLMKSPWFSWMVIAGSILASLCATCRANAPSATEILWDTWGVPHVYAPDRQSLWYAYGWSQAADHGDLLLRLYGESRGRAAEYWGAAHLGADQWVHRVGIVDRSTRWYEQIKPEYRRMHDSFAAGINAYAQAHPDEISPEARRVLPVTPHDVLNHFQRVIHFTFVADLNSIGARAVEPWRRAGSNAWAIGPEHTASARPILLANPHLPWSGLFTWHESHLVCPGLNIYGAALVGMPFVAIGFNDHLGWTHTVNTFDGMDLYDIQLTEGGYRFEGQVLPLTERRHMLKVRQAEGTFQTHELLVSETVHGPVIAVDGARALAMRVTGLDAPHALEQYWGMATSQNLRQFQAAHALLQMPLFTTLYADRHGQIMHLFGGRVPVRKSGDWSDWSRPVPGGTRDTLWSAAHDYTDLPRVIDPATGWLQNANDPPWTTTFPRALDRHDYPPYMAPPWSGPMVQLRAQRSARLLIDAPRPMTLPQVIAAKHSTRMELADRILDDLAAAVEQHGDATARAAMAVLSKWDRQAQPESRGAVLFLTFIQRFGLDRFAQPWADDQPLTTPDGLADPPTAAARLADAARAVQAAHGSLDVPWGEVYRIRHGGLDLPSNGGPGALGIFRNVEYRPEPDGKFRAFGGDSFVLAVEFTDPPAARALLPYGNRSRGDDAGSPAQFELFARQELRPVWRDRSEVEAHLRRRQPLTPPGEQSPAR